jgi:tetratricopeptide (TPR) repeat protein
MLVIRECFAHGLDELGRELLEEEVQRFESDPYYADPRRKADVLHMLGRNEEAMAIYQEVAEAYPDNPWQGHYQMGIEAASMGDTALALEIDRRIAEWPREAGNPASFPLVRAQIHARLGHREEAFRLLESAYFDHGLAFQEYHHAVFDLLPLQGYPPFDELMRGVDGPGLPQP